MKKIGIVTYNKSFNYGARLQAYSMLKIFQNMGYEAEVINVNYPIRYLKYLYSSLIGKSINPLRWIDKWIISHKMVSFNNKNIKSTKFLLTKSTQKMIDFINAQNYDAVVCGSDEIWSGRTSEIAPPSIYYLPQGINAQRIAFSPSANGNHQFSEKEIRWLDKTLSGFTLINVRDTFTKEKLKLVFNVKREIYVGYDPTFSVTFNPVDLPKRVMEKSDKKKIGLAFALPTNGLGESITKKLGAKYKIFSIMNRIPNTEFLRLSPEQFAYVFKEFDYVVTNLYHATAFSVKANTPVFGVTTFENYKDRKGKIEELLDRNMNLDNFYSYVEPSMDVVEEICYKIENDDYPNCINAIRKNIEEVMGQQIDRTKRIIDEGL